MTVADRFTGKLRDHLSGLFPHPNGKFCDYCGHYTIDRCGLCCAPQCCPRCCIETLEQGNMEVG